MGGLVSLAAFILMIIAKYKLFEKSGEPGWKAMVPFLSKIKFCSLFSGKKGIYLAITMFISFFLMFLSISKDLPLLFVLSGLAYLIANIKSNYDLGRSFKKESGFNLGLIFLPGIFIPLLGLGNDNYYGPQGKSDYFDPNIPYPNMPDPQNPVQYLGTNAGHEYNAADFSGGYQNQQYSYQNANVNIYNSGQPAGSRNAYNQAYPGSGAVYQSPNTNAYTSSGYQNPGSSYNSGYQNPNNNAYAPGYRNANNTGGYQNQGSYAQRFNNPNSNRYSSGNARQPDPWEENPNNGNTISSDNAESNTINKYYQGYNE